MFGGFGFEVPTTWQAAAASFGSQLLKQANATQVDHRMTVGSEAAEGRVDTAEATTKRNAKD